MHGADAPPGNTLLRLRSPWDRHGAPAAAGAAHRVDDRQLYGLPSEGMRRIRHTGSPAFPRFYPVRLYPRFPFLTTPDETPRSGAHYGRKEVTAMTPEDNIRRWSSAWRRRPRSSGDTAPAFLVGGAIRVVGAAASHWYGTLGLDTADAGTATSVTLVFLSVLATGLGVDHKLACWAGAARRRPSPASPVPASSCRGLPGGGPYHRHRREDVHRGRRRLRWYRRQRGVRSWCCGWCRPYKRETPGVSLFYVSDSVVHAVAPFQLLLQLELQLLVLLHQRVVVGALDVVITKAKVASLNSSSEYSGSREPFLRRRPVTLMTTRRRCCSLSWNSFSVSGISTPDRSAR